MKCLNDRVFDVKFLVKMRGAVLGIAARIMSRQVHVKPPKACKNIITIAFLRKKDLASRDELIKAGSAAASRAPNASA